MAGAGGLGRWFVDVGLPGTQRNAFGQLNGGAVGKGILFSMINQVLPGFGNYLGHRSDVANHAWDSMGGFLNNGEGKIDPSSLMDYGTNLGGFQIDRNFPGVNMGGTPSVGNTPPAGQPPLDSGLTYQAPDFQIDRTIAPVKVDGSAGGGRFGNYNAFGNVNGAGWGGAAGSRGNGTSGTTQGGGVAGPMFGSGWGWKAF